MRKRREASRGCTSRSKPLSFQLETHLVRVRVGVRVRVRVRVRLRVRVRVRVRVSRGAPQRRVRAQQPRGLREEAHEVGREDLVRVRVRVRGRGSTKSGEKICSAWGAAPAGVACCVCGVHDYRSGPGLGLESGSGQWPEQRGREQQGCVRAGVGGRGRAWAGAPCRPRARWRGSGFARAARGRAPTCSAEPGRPAPAASVRAAAPVAAATASR